MLKHRALIGRVLIIIGILASACDVAPLMPATFHPRTPGPSSMVGERVVRYEQEGGLAGRHDVLEIGLTGGVRVNDKVITPGLLPERLVELQASFTEIHFFDLKDLYDDPSRKWGDDFYDSVTYTLNGQTKTVTVARHGGANISPDDLDGVIHYLHRLLLGFGGLAP